MGEQQTSMADAGRAGSLLAPDAPLTMLPGVGPTTAKRLAAAGIDTVLALAWFFPRRYRALRELARPEESCIGELVRMAAEVHNTRLNWLPGRRAMVTITFACDDGSKFDTAFFNQPWLRRNYPAGQRRTVEGTLQQKGRKFVLQSARILPVGVDGDGDVQLRYAEIEGVGAARLQKWIQQALDQLDWSRVTLPAVPAELDDFDRSPRETMLAMHRPRDVEHHETARRHFALREAFALFSSVERARRNRERREAVVFEVDESLRQRIFERIPFELTSEQRAAVDGMWRRLAGPSAMGVLLQGDVGSGKTAVAIAVALAVVKDGAMCAFLAPTELLAEQHHRAVSHWLKGTGVSVVLCTASNKQKPPTGGPRIVFGTHALLGAELPGLGLVVVDEQHRFGVAQRMALIQKGVNPHVLVMTATPIPRTLALVLFGDLDVVTLRGRPPGRRPVPAFQLDQQRWSRATRSIARAVRRGGKVFVVCPAVGEEGEKGGVMRVHDALQQSFRCALVHGRLKASERQRALALFRDGIVDVLVGTTVLEVGVDVPEATLVVVVGADRFGIATLHQIRGRVGRGEKRGIALLCGPNSERVAAVCATTDGYELAEKDLVLRGSGELLGTQQSGFGELRCFDPVEDLDLLRRVRDAAREVPSGEEANGR